MTLNIDGTSAASVTIDGQSVSEITADGDVVFGGGGGGLPTSQLTQIADHIWYMDEGSGGSTADSAGGATGSISGADWVAGQGGAGDAYLDFPNSDDIVNCGNVFDTQDEFTVSVWGELTSTTNGSYVVQQGVADGFLIWDPGSRDEVGVTVNGVASDNVSVTPGWHMFSLTGGTDGSATFYVDGTQEVAYNPGVPSWDSGNAFTFGNREDLARPWNDGVDMGVVAYQEATASDISDHYQATQGLY